MRVLRSIASVFVIFCLLFGIAHSAGVETDPESIVRGVASRLSSELSGLSDTEKRVVVNNVMNAVVIPVVDFEKVSRIVLGKHWRVASSEQRSRFVNAFAKLLINTYSEALMQVGDADIAYSSDTKSAKEEIIVKTVVSGKSFNKAISMDYRFHYKDGGWLLYDVSVEGMSFALNYRATFAQEISSMGIDRLIDSISARRQESKRSE